MIAEAAAGAAQAAAAAGAAAAETAAAASPPAAAHAASEPDRASAARSGSLPAAPAAAAAAFAFAGALHCRPRFPLQEIMRQASISLKNPKAPDLQGLKDVCVHPIKRLTFLIAGMPVRLPDDFF